MNKIKLSRIEIITKIIQSKTSKIMALRSGTTSKKNDLMSQQIANSLKMSAYLNKNTFSSATALPPEENRLNMKDIVSKGSNPVWLRKGEVDDKSYRIAQRRKYYKEQIANFKKKNKGNFANCHKCGQGGHFAHECMNTLDVGNLEREKTNKEISEDLLEKIKFAKKVKKRMKKKKEKKERKEIKKRKKKERKKEKKKKEKAKRKRSRSIEKRRRRGERENFN